MAQGGRGKVGGGREPTTFPRSKHVTSVGTSSLTQVKHAFDREGKHLKTSGIESDFSSLGI